MAHADRSVKIVLSDDSVVGPGNGLPTTGGGGGGSDTQYAEGATAVTATGTLSMWKSGTTLTAASTATPFPVSVISGGGGGVADDSTYTAGSSTFLPTGGVFNDSIADATTGKADGFRITAKRGLHVNLRNASGTEISPATETTLSALNTKIPASPATDRATAAAPFSVRLSDGSAFYVGAKTGQLPTALTGSGNLSTAVAEALPTGANTIGKVDQGAGGASAWKVDGSAVTQPVSASSLPLPTGAATETTLAALNTKIPASPATDRSTAAAPFSVRLSTGAAFYDGTKTGQLPTALSGSGNLSTAVAEALPTGANVIGGVTQSGTWNVGLSTGANTVGKVDQGTGGASAWKVDGSAVTQPISASALPLPTGAATETTLAALNTKIPASPATDRATAAAPFSVRLSDGSAFYDGTKTGQLPSALVSGRLDVNIGAASATVTVAGSGTFTVAGAKTNNNAAPGATNAGVIGYLANAADPSWTEGNQVGGSVNLAGYQRMIGQIQGTVANGVAVPANPVSIGFTGASGLLRNWTGINSENNTAGLNTPAVGVQVWDGTTNYNRILSANGADNSGGAGIAAAGNVYWDGSVWRRGLGTAAGHAVVGGAQADNAALAGNPLRLGVSDGTNIQTWKQGVFTAAQTATGIPVVTIVSSNGTTFDPVKNDGGGASASLRVNLASGGSTASIAAASDGTPSAGLLTYSVAMHHNGTNADRTRGNVDVTLLASAARTTTQTSADITTYNIGAITFVLDMTTVGTGSVTISIDGKDAVSGKYYNLLTGAAVTTNSTNVYVVDPVIPAVANVSAQKRLPRIIRIVVTAGNANSATYSVGYTLQPA